MSAEEVILMHEAGVKTHNSESPPTFGLRAGAFAELGTLILTDKRLVYVSKGGDSRAAAWALGGALAARAVEKRVSEAELDDLMKYEGSYSIPLLEITLVQSARKMGQAYIRVDDCRGGQKHVRSFAFGGDVSRSDTWSNAVKSAITAGQTQNAQADTPSQQFPLPPPPPPAPTTPICSSCGYPLTYIQQYQRWYCYREQRYV